MKTSTHLVFFALLFIYGQAQITNYFSFDKIQTFSSSDLTSGFKSSVYVESISSVFYITPTALVRWNFISSNSTITETNANEITNLQVILWNSVLSELWVVTNDYPGQIGRFSTTDLTIINGDATNPLKISEMVTALAGVATDSYAYFINKNYLFRWSLSSTDLSAYDVLTLNTSLTLSTIQANSDTETLYVGTKEGYAIIVQPATTLSLSTITTYSIFPTSSYNNIITSFIDVTHGYMYYVTQGGTKSGESSPQVGRQNLDLPSNITVINLDPTDYNAISSIIDEVGGIAYIGMALNPGKVSQVTLPTFALEGSNYISDSVDPLTSAAFYYSDGDLLYFTASNTADGPYLVLVTPADPCEDDCYSHGTCSYRNCTCDLSTSPKTGAPVYYAKPWCEYLNCDYDCNDHGTCNTDSTCTCEASWGGRFCSDYQCPNDCSSTLNQGTCKYNTSGYPIECVCASGWTGSDCSDAISSPTLPCDERYTCGDCVINGECGWCNSHESGVCTYGNQIGPTISNLSDAAYQTCKYWFYSSCPNTGTYILNWVLSTIIVILWIVNVGSAILQDSSPQDTEKRTEWYRFTRSSKLHLIFYQIQFIALCGLLGKELPSLLFDYTRWWYVSLLAAPLPWFTASVGSSTRFLLDLDQYQIYSLVEARADMFMVIFVWFFIFLGASIILFALSILIGVVRGVEEFSKKYHGRFFYVIFRVVDLSYFGIVTFSAAQIASQKSGVWYGLAYLFYIVIGVVYPIATIVWLNKADSKQFFLDEIFKIKWQPIYGLFDKGKKLRFAILTFLPRFLLGTFFGFPIGVPALQLTAALVIFILHTIAVLQIDPYRDYLHKYITVFLNIINIITICCLFGALANPDIKGYFGITVAFMLFQTIAIVGGLVFYIMVWLHMYEVYTPAQLLTSIRGGGGGKSAKDK